VQVVGTCSGTGVDTDKNLVVRVCYDHPLIIGIPYLMPGPIEMCSSTAIRVAQ
jgi:hypothetical protein